MNQFSEAASISKKELFHPTCQILKWNWVSRKFSHILTQPVKFVQFFTHTCSTFEKNFVNESTVIRKYKTLTKDFEETKYFLTGMNEKPEETLILQRLRELRRSCSFALFLTHNFEPVFTMTR